MHSKAQIKNPKNNGSRIKTLVVDDSPLMCKVVSEILDEDGGFEVIGQALNGQEALRMLDSMPCDLCTLDVHMPGMNGLTVLKHIMIRYPTPTLMVSAFTADGSKITFDALRYGAVDFFHKPSRDNGKSMSEQGDLLRKKAKDAAKVQLDAVQYLRLRNPSRQPVKASRKKKTDSMVIIHGATGSYASLLNLMPIMEKIPASPMIVSVSVDQEHLKAFVKYLQSYIPYDMNCAAGTQEIRPGSIYFMSKDQAGTFDYKKGKLVLETAPRPDLNDKEGGIDLLLFSAAEHFGRKALAIFLSGENNQGVTGAGELLRSNGSVMVQRLETCLRPELPEAVLEHKKAGSATLLELAKKASSWS